MKMALCENTSMWNSTSGSPCLAKVAMLNCYHFTILEERCGEIIIKSGVEAMLLMTLAELLHFKYKIYIPPDKQWGSMNSNGSWTGLIGMVHRKEAHIAMGGIHITALRHKHVIFPSAYIASPLKIITKDSRFSSRSSILLRAYSYKLWIMIMVTVLFVMATLSLISKASHQKKNYKPCWFVFSSLVFKASLDDVPSSTNTRIFIILWWIFVFIIMTAFGGLITSSTTVAVNKDNIDSLQELVFGIEKGEYGLLSLKGSSIAEFIFKSTSGPLQHISEMLHQNPHWQFTQGTEILSLISKARSKMKYAFLETSNFEIFHVQNNMYFHYSKENFMDFYTGMAISRDFIPVETMNRRITRITAVGLLEKWTTMSYYYLFGPKVFLNGQSSADQSLLIGIDDLRLIFQCLIISHCFSVLVLVVERLLHYIKGNKIGMNRVTPVRQIPVFNDRLIYDS